MSKVLLLVITFKHPKLDNNIQTEPEYLIRLG